MPGTSSVPERYHYPALGDNVIDIEKRLDPELAALRALYPSLGFDLDDLPGSRAIMDKLAERARLPAGTDVVLECVTVSTGSSPDQCSLRIFRSEKTTGDVPVMLWIHGGGYVLGSAADTDRRLGDIVRGVGCAVVSVDYRLAPEHPFPAGLDDCFSALAWIEENAGEYGFDPSRIAIGGASAGGGLAAALAQRARDTPAGPTPVLQLLIYPMLDDRNTTPSSHGIEDPTLWDRATNLKAWNFYLGDRAGADTLPDYAAPARMTNLVGLPSTFIAVGDLDLFLDEDIEYAQRLLQAGVPTELHVLAGAIHGFDILAPDAALTQRLNRDVDDALIRAFTRAG